MRLVINNKSMHPVTKCILSGVLFVLTIYVGYVLFFIAMWGIFIGMIAYCFISLKNHLFRNKCPRHKPITIEHDRE